ncbi:saccharopine dehydrogenase [Nocardia sp. XZ_19_385]|uniref:saccharopine dehydrogenase n=1 Tax=Nocardia sp. XZ_19_385 TaxID=2769488 RepID=UPI00188E8C41|nr:saccharopine dehydrogenase [Nocardia sp. XZ_19_385]
MNQSKSVLIMGGSGQAGSDTAALLRRWHPELPLTIAGRNLDRAQHVADRLGIADAVTIDLTRGDLGLPDDRDYSAVVATLWDSHHNGLSYAQDHGLPYLSISSGMFDIGPEVVASAQKASAAPILVASHYLAGLAVLATLEAARAFNQIDSIRIGAVLDELDAGGPAGLADLERWTTVTAAGLIRRDGVFTWISESEAQTEVPSADGTLLPGQSVAILDVPSLALATRAPNVRFDLAIGESTSRRRDKPASTELRIDLAGTSPAGTPLTTSHYLTHPDGQRPLTALAIALGVERMLGLRGEKVPPGIHTPEALHDPSYVTEKMAEIGAIFAPA